jgi:hypothetical protein
MLCSVIALLCVALLAFLCRACAPPSHARPRRARLGAAAAPRPTARLAGPGRAAQPRLSAERGAGNTGMKGI